MSDFHHGLQLLELNEAEMLTTNLTYTLSSDGEFTTGIGMEVKIG